ncbi:hypothetical protein JOD43_003833 [Pullulanibacillus pueri]|uniref:BCE-2095-like N-terminal domain-containing protein n=1 Tax=Pullulanibacillus pueri TaxID=1437324 RepID=A0A8J2ZYT6_9BACL|nr:hypothetical protein [Pullulanibacillus pueri]MBM7683653.1 hypothetical protein [Pullulanibacillus pueri]GGH87213.1 hypothetical protein GCM10007096_36710 [Pullulanibacillus pueri]
MSHQSFIDLQQQIIDFTIEGKYKAVQQLLNEKESEFAEKVDQMVFWKACVLASLGQKSEAVQVLEEAVDNGVWWHPDLLKKSADLYSLQGDRRFNKIIERCEQMDALKLR